MAKVDDKHDQRTEKYFIDKLDDAIWRKEHMVTVGTQYEAEDLDLPIQTSKQKILIYLQTIAYGKSDSINAEADLTTDGTIWLQGKAYNKIKLIGKHEEIKVVEDWKKRQFLWQFSRWAGDNALSGTLRIYYDETWKFTEVANLGTQTEETFDNKVVKIQVMLHSVIYEKKESINAMAHLTVDPVYLPDNPGEKAKEYAIITVAGPLKEIELINDRVEPVLCEAWT